MIPIVLFMGKVAGATFDRESAACARAEPTLRRYAKVAGVAYPPKQILFRVFKQEKQLEVWGGDSALSKLKRLVRYQILAASGSLGPKREQGDMQVPEGWYFVNRFNPSSAYHLSLGLNYPNASDRIFATARDPGDDIFIHGNQVSAGCMAMGDPSIEQIYTIAKLSKNRVPVLILPSRTKPPESGNHSNLWDQIYEINVAFGRTHKIPNVSIDGNGNYIVR